MKVAPSPGPSADRAGPNDRRWPVRTYLLVMLAVAGAAVAAAGVYGFLWSSGKATSDAKHRMTLQAGRAAASMSASLATAKRTAEGLAAQPDLARAFRSPGSCQLSADGTEAFPKLRLDIVDRTGRVACSSDRALAARASAVHHGSAWLHAALRSRGTLVAPRAVDAATGAPSLVVARPVPGSHGPAGVVAVLLALPGTAAALAGGFDGIQHASFTVVEQTTGAVVDSSELPADRLRGVRFRHTQTSGDWTGIGGSRRLFGSARVPGTNWRVYSGVQRAKVLAGARGTLLREGLVGIVALLILALAAWVLNRRVAGPLRAIADTVAQTVGEPGGLRVREAGTAEIASLARAFTTMLDVRAGHEAQLAYQAAHDAVTGLPNRMIVRQQLDEALRGDRRDLTAVLCFGVDRLDVVTDSFGHEVGERVLVAVAARLAAALRPGDSLARSGAAEFVVLCPDLDGGDAAELAERLHGCLEEPFPGPEADIVIRGSIGIAEAGGSGTGPDELLRQADSAMREARRTGLQFCRFDRALQDRATQHLRIEHDLRQALKRDELVVHYQPLMDLRSGRIVGVEALVRWRHPERGMVPPLDFIPVAEQTGQIVQIGRVVLEQACSQAVAWRAAGYALRISVNVAVAQLRDDGFAADVARVLAQTGLAAGQLCLEITESSLLNVAGRAAAGLEALRRLGVRIAVDDFGTGYSSLAYLHQMPVDELKIDRAFVSRLERDERDRHLVVAIMGMARALDLTVVAEGVETRGQHDLLSGFDCRLAQGYLFSPPQPANELVSLLDAQRAALPASVAA